MALTQCVMNDKVVADVNVADAFTTITAGVGGHKGARIERPDESTLVIVTRYTPGWAVLLAILGFLFLFLGLLFLLVKREARVTIIGRDVDEGARFTVAGFTSQPVAAFLKGYLVPAAG